MATTFDTAAAAVAADWIVVIAIDGVGDAATGQFKFCSAVPTYGGGNYKPYLTEFPRLASERIDPLGGGIECGELSFDVLDYDDEISALIRADASPTTIIDPASAEVSTLATSITVLNATALSAGDLVWIGNETIRINTIAANVLTVSRAQIGTDAQEHNTAGKLSRVFEFPAYMRSRRVRLSLAPANAASAADEREFWVGHLDGIALSSDTNSFVFRAKSQMKYLDRLIYRGHSAGFRFDPASMSLESLDLRPLMPDPSVSGGGFFPPFLHDSTGFPVNYVRMGDEIVAAVIVSTGSNYRLLMSTSTGAERGALNTPRGNFDEKIVSVVFSADADHPACSFRFSPDDTATGGSAPSTDRNTGSWVKSAHFVDVLLALLTSSATQGNADGLELVNFTAGFPNFSALPAGIGAGIPAELVDFASWLDVRARSPAYRFPGFLLESDSIPFVELAEKFFLRLVGAHLTTTDGKIGLLMPAHPLAGVSAPAFDLSNILSRSVGNRSRLPEVNAAQDMARVASAVRFELRGPRGEPVTTTVTDAEYGDLFGQGGHYAAEDGRIDLKAPASITDAAGIHAALEECAVRKLRRFRRPQWRLTGLKTDLSRHAINPGDLVSVTHPGLPNAATGGRGWVDVVCQVLEKTPVFDAVSNSIDGGSAPGLHFEWTLSGYGPGGRFARVSPSALVSSVSTNTATVEANRATAADGADAGLPSNDAAAFFVGDVVELRSRSGESIAADATETVISTNAATSALELSGNFGGALAASTVIAYCAYASATSAQKSQFVFLADRVDMTIGATSDRAWEYGEP